jgi:hypothetical protein
VKKEVTLKLRWKFSISILNEGEEGREERSLSSKCRADKEPMCNIRKQRKWGRKSRRR